MMVNSLCVRPGAFSPEYLLRLNVAERQSRCGCSYAGSQTKYSSTSRRVLQSASLLDRCASWRQQSVQGGNSCRLAAMTCLRGRSRGPLARGALHVEARFSEVRGFFDNDNYALMEPVQEEEVVSVKELKDKLRPYLENWPGKSLPDDLIGKVEAALAEAAESTAELERLREESKSLWMTMLTKDFDLTHERSGKAALEDKVQFLERTVANYEQVAEVRDTKLSEAMSLIEELEALRDSLEAEQGALRSKLLSQEFDLTHAIATRAILSDRVDDLQAEGEKLNTALADALSSKAELEGKITSLETALTAVRKEERALRASQAELRRQVINLQSDAGALTRAKTARTSMLKDKERQLKDLEEALSRAQKEAAYLERQLSGARGVREQRRAAGPEYVSEDIGEDPAVAWFRKLSEVRADQERQWLESDSDMESDDPPKGSDDPSDDEGSSVGTQLAKIATAQTAVRREEEAAEANKAKNATDEDDDAAAEKKASRTYQAAGASVLLATAFGSYLLWAPQMDVPVWTSAPRRSLEKLVALNPLKQLAFKQPADVPKGEKPSEAEEPSEEDSDSSVMARATLQEASETVAKQDAPKDSIADVDREGGLGSIFVQKENATEDVLYDTPKEAPAAVDADKIDCAVSMC